jgi:hypothetical protein
VVSARAWRQTHTYDFGDGMRYPLDVATGGGGGSGRTLRRGCAASEKAVNGGMAGQNE